MADAMERHDLRLILYGVIASALVFLVYDVASAFVEQEPIQHILAKMFAFPLAVIIGGLAVRIFPIIHRMSNRKTIIFFVILGGISIVLCIISQTQITSNIAIKTDWSSYAGSETIRVSGEVKHVVPNEKVSILILYPDNEIYNSTSVSLIDNSNAFEYKFNIKGQGNHFATNVYSIWAMYDKNVTRTLFAYEDNSPSLQITPSG